MEAMTASMSAETQKALAVEKELKDSSSIQILDAKNRIQDLELEKEEIKKELAELSTDDRATIAGYMKA